MTSSACSLFWLTLYRWTAPPVALLWTYLWWYIFVISIHFSPSAEVWGNAAGISIVVSIALNFNACQPPFREYVKKNYVSVFLFLAIPFLVASYASTVGMANRDSPGTFYAIIPLRGNEGAVLFGVGVSLLAALITIHVLVGRFVLTDEQKKEIRLEIGHVQAKDQNRNRFQFFVKCFRPPLAVLWGIFFWYLWVVAQNPPPSQILVTALLSSCFVGMAHNANVYRPTLREYVFNHPLKVGRFFIVPFCVASYSGAATAHRFSFFPPSAALSSVGVLLSLLVGASGYLFWYKYADPETECSNTHHGTGDLDMAGHGVPQTAGDGTSKKAFESGKTSESSSGSEKTVSSESRCSSDVAKLESGNTVPMV